MCATKVLKSQFQDCNAYEKNDYIHSQARSLGGAKYFLSLVDDFSRMV